MSTENRYIRHGIGAARPYLYGGAELPEFVKRVFGAEELERVESPRGAHVELRIGDSVLVLETVETPASASPASCYVYVEDVDATYRRALQAGAVALAEPEDKPYRDRGAGVKDSFGNTWWIATHTGSN